MSLFLFEPLCHHWEHSLLKTHKASLKNERVWTITVWQKITIFWCLPHRKIIRILYLVWYWFLNDRIATILGGPCSVSCKDLLFSSWCRSSLSLPFSSSGVFLKHRWVRVEMCLLLFKCWVTGCPRASLWKNSHKVPQLESAVAALCLPPGRRKGPIGSYHRSFIVFYRNCGVF